MKHIGRDEGENYAHSNVEKKPSFQTVLRLDKAGNKIAFSYDLAGKLKISCHPIKDGQNQRHHQHDHWPTFHFILLVYPALRRVD
ncbi:MAG: hypothetical protein AAB673_01590 [Patescibacteria group bacterium]